VPSRGLLVALVVAISTSGCTAFSESLGGPPGEPAPTVAGTGAVASAPDEALTVLADEDPVETAAAMSRALFARSPVVVVARVGDRAGVLLGASAAVGLGVPLLLEPEDGSVSEVLASEVDRLDVDAVLAIGPVDGPVGPDVVSVPASPAAVAEATGLDLGAAETVPGESDVAAVAALDPADPVALQPEDAAPSSDEDVEGSLPPVERGDPVAGAVVLATEAPESVAAVATAGAAGAPVVVTDDTDPRASEAVLEALADADAEAVVAVGTGFGGEPGLDWKVATALAGDELPGGGQLLFPGRMLVALYGHPGTGALGVLGEQPLDAAIERARAHAAPYEPLVDVPVVPAFEIIATVASSAAGPDGNYSAEADPEDLRPWVEAAGEAGLYVVLDLQPGRTDFLTQAEQYRSLLELPHVGLALDPEWRLGPNEVHLTQIGSVDIEEVNRVVAWLADLTRENALPQKLFVLHQFRLDMLPGRERLDARDELAILIHADGQGSQGDKQATWRTLRQGAPGHVTWGWKNFYDEDSPVLTPEQTIDQVDPRPELITYQ
jgi:hypothetical protein